MVCYCSQINCNSGTKVVAGIAGTLVEPYGQNWGTICIFDEYKMELEPQSESISLNLNALFWICLKNTDWLVGWASICDFFALRNLRNLKIRKIACGTGDYYFRVWCSCLKIIISIIYHTFFFFFLPTIVSKSDYKSSELILNMIRFHYIGFIK